MKAKIDFRECEGYKARIDAYRPLPQETVKSLRAYYKIGLTYSSNALEGNSLTESETKVVIEDGLTIGGKPMKDVYEAVGHAKAYDYMYDLAKLKPLTQADILKLHELFYANIDKMNAGAYRAVRVFISGSKYAPPGPEKIASLMKAFIAWFNQQEKKLHPVEFAALVHQKFVFIHPFVDGNGRVSRLLMNLALIRAGYNISVIPPILRNDYIQALEKAHTDTAPFIQFILGRVVETQKELLRLFGEDLSSVHARGGVKSEVGGVNAGARGGVKSTKNCVLDAVKAQAGINAPTLSNRLAISLRTTQRTLKELSVEGVIVFKGAPKNGGYFMNADSAKR
jgi:Fic family protein